MARKQAVFLSCDDPQCPYTIELDAGVSKNDVPVGWHKLTADNGEGEWQQVSWEFHSLRCVERFAKARRVAVAPAINGANGASPITHAAQSRIEQTREALAIGEPVRASEIASLTGMSSSTVRGHLLELLATGEIYEVEPRRGPNGARYQAVA